MALYENADAVEGLRETEYIIWTAKAKKRFGTQFSRKDMDAVIKSVRNESDGCGDDIEELRKLAGTRPAIRLSRLVGSAYSLNEDPHGVVQMSLAVLEGANEPPRLFCRGTSMARVHEQQGEPPTIVPIGDNEVRAELLQEVVYYEESLVGPNPKNPPVHLIKAIQGQDAYPFPQLDGVALAPALRRDCTVAATAGYDSKTKLYLWRNPSGKKITIPAKPSPGDVARATEILRESVCDFPFADQASRANCFAMQLTPFLVDLVGGHRPVFVIDANQAGAGKTLLGQEVALAATLRDPRLISGAFKNDEELEKQITEVLHAGAAVVLIDNVKRKLESASLESVLTSARWTRRVLGKNTQAVDVPQRATFLVTGNNLQVGSEIGRRSVLVRLRSDTNAPEQREGFRHEDLLRWVKDNRERIAASAIVLAVAWNQAGRPPTNAPIMGSFQGWATTLAGILAFAGIEGFLGNRYTFRAQRDIEAAEWIAFLHALGMEMRGAEFTARDVNEAIGRCSNLGNTCPSVVQSAADVSRGGSTRKLTSVLTRIEGRHFDKYGLRLERRDADGHAKVLQWIVLGLEGRHDG